MTEAQQADSLLIPAEETAVDALMRWTDDPVAFVRECLCAEPDAWQADAMRAVMSNKRVAMTACKGPGKSCLMAWIAWWFICTRIDAQIMILSITSDNLRDNLWKELAKWQAKSEFLTKAFDYGAKRVSNRTSPDTWWMSARAFARDANAEQQANSLAGFHAEHLMVILDEVGDYPHGVVAAADAIFATEAQEARLVVAGNPTSMKGPLYKICTAKAGNWERIRITGDPDDPKRSSRIDIDWARSLINDLGRDNAWVMVNVLGEFPPQGATTLVSVNDVHKAQERSAKFDEYGDDARVWGLDPAYEGLDASCLARRQGIVCFAFKLWYGLKGPELAAQIIKMILEASSKDRRPHRIFIDRGGVGASCFDHLQLLGYGGLLVGVDFGGKADGAEFYDVRSEMWWRMSEWIGRYPANLPSQAGLAEELTEPQMDYDVRGHRTCLKLESKKQMRKRGVKSPNMADALALTFRSPVIPTDLHRDLQGFVGNKVETDFDPYASLNVAAGPQSSALNIFDPYRGR
jgi:phage terminase large subunit